MTDLMCLIYKEILQINTEKMNKEPNKQKNKNTG